MKYLNFLRFSGLFDFILINFISFEKCSSDKVILIFLSLLLFIFQEYNILSEIGKKIKTSYILFIIYGIVNIYFPENRVVLKKICIFILSFLAIDFELKKYKNKY
jgi:hypothetical protein